jgi:hypothetical protein
VNPLEVFLFHAGQHMIRLCAMSALLVYITPRIKPVKASMGWLC